MPNKPGPINPGPMTNPGSHLPPARPMFAPTTSNISRGSNQSVSIVTPDSGNVENVVQLSDKTYVSKSDFDNLSKDNQTKLMQLGVSRFNDFQTAQYNAAIAASQTASQSAGATPDEQSRINELNNIIKANEDILARISTGEYNATDYNPNTAQSLADQKQSLSMLQNAIAVRQSYAAAGIAVPKDVQEQLDKAALLSSAKLSPYVDNSTGSVDVALALKMGIPENDLSRIGISADVIAQANAQNLIQTKYRGDPKAAILGGDIASVRALYGDDQTLDLQIAVANRNDPLNQETTTADYVTWANNLEMYQRDVYQKAGGGESGYQAVMSAQQAALNQVNADAKFAAVTLPDGTQKGYLQYDFSKFSEQTWVNAGFNAVDYGKGLGQHTTPFRAIQSSPSLFTTMPEAVGIAQSIHAATLLNASPTTQTVQTLRDLHYPQSIIDGAQRQVDAVNAAKIDEIPSVLSANLPNGKSDLTGQVQALVDAISHSGFWDNSLLGAYNFQTGMYVKNGKPLTQQDQTAIVWESLTDDQRAVVSNKYIADLYRFNPFAETVKQGQEAKAESGAIGTVVSFVEPFVPVTGMIATSAEMIAGSLAKSTTHQKVGAMEIGVDVASTVAATLGVPGISTMLGIVPTSLLQAGVIGTFGTNLGVNYSKMTPLDRAVNIGMLVAPLAAGSVIRTGESVILSMRSDYVPLRSMSTEARTARIEPTAEQWADMQKAGVTETDVLAANDELSRQLVSGAKVAKVKLGTVTYEIKNVPYQQAVGLSLFSSTPDITQVDRGGSVPVFRDLYTAPKVAIEPLERSYVSGQQAVHPGIIEIRVADPSIINDIAISKPGNMADIGHLESEIRIPSPEELSGMGYRLVPIPEAAGGHGVTFDANLGKIEIRRFTLAKVVGDETGVRITEIGGSGDGGLVVVPDMHAAAQFRGVYEAVNSKYSEPIIVGNPDAPDTWHYAESAVSTGRTVVQAGDILDPGDVAVYETWRNTFNRLHDEALASGTGDRIERVLGNHELAISSGDQISGYPHIDTERAILKPEIYDDVLTGRVKAGVSADDSLVTHAGVSKGVFPEFSGKTADTVSRSLNTMLSDAYKTDDFSSAMFAKGRTEKGNSLSYNERNQGGPFWLRPQEATPAQLDLGFRQVVGHNPGSTIRSIWGDNFIEADVNVKGGRAVDVYGNTPYVKTEIVPIQTAGLGGTPPNLSSGVLTELRMKAMRDTVADVFLGWDGRVYAIDRIKSSQKAVKALIKSIDAQIALREAAGDSIGVAYLGRQKSELIMPTGRDYLYGGIALWRDIVMGRQNSVHIVESAGTATTAQLMGAAATISNVRNSITIMSDQDVRSLFGYSRNQVLSALDTSSIKAGMNPDELRAVVSNRANNLVNIVDTGLGRSVAPLLDSAVLSNRYAVVLQDEINQSSTSSEAGNDRMIQVLPESEPVVPGRTLSVSESERTPIASESESVVSGREPIETRATDSTGVSRAVGSISDARVMSPERVAETRDATLETGVTRATSGRGIDNRGIDSRATDNRGVGVEGNPPYNALPYGAPPYSVPPYNMPPYTQPPYVPPPYVPPPYVPPPYVPPPYVPSSPILGVSGSLSASKSNSGMFTWYQGERSVGGEMRDIWYIIKAPYKTAADAFVSDYPPKGATVVKDAGAAHLTIKQLTGEAPSEVIMRMGVMDIDVTGKGDKINSIRFISDPDHIYETQIDLKDATYLDSQPTRKYVVGNKKPKSRSKKSSDTGLGMIR